MKLTAENFPLSCSLQTLVQDTFAGAGGEAEGHAMPLEELLAYLRNPGDLDLTPYADLLGQTEAMGDPALPSRSHTAVLRWVGEAMHHFERRFPLEEPLASQVRRLKPLAAAIALKDADFMQPDVHPLHQLLDSIQERAVGWQSRLGRAGAVLEQQVANAVDEALAWFDDEGADLANVCASFLAAAERDRTRAERMANRVVEAELGKVRTAAAKREAARVINGALERYRAPLEIGEFLKGPWYASAQLLLLKFGADSAQWQRMAETTETLLDSVQSLEGASEERRQHIFAVVTQLPKDMRRWLLSLHHDADAVNEAMGVVEFAHLRILRRQPVELETIGGIETAGSGSAAGRPELLQALRAVEEGRWFSVQTRREGSLRVRLSLKAEQEQRLLFTNLAGMKVLEYSFEEFDELLGRKCVTALPAGGGFSLCLAIAAGIDTTEKLDSLYTMLAEEAGTTGLEPDAEPDAAQPGVEDAEAAVDTATEIQWLIEREQVDLAAGAQEEEAGIPQAGGAGPAESGQAPATGDDLLSEEEMRGLEALIGDGEPAAVAEPAGSGFLADQASSFFPMAGEEPPTAGAAGTGGQPAPPGEALAEDEAEGNTLDLPMGAWLGFHDGDMPMMAKLAVHDPDADIYIFVNRNGIKLRQLRGGELARLMDEGLVDILQTRSRFREDVDTARRDLE